MTNKWDSDMARAAGLSAIVDGVNFKIDGFDNAYYVVVFGRGLEHPYQKTMLLVINDQIIGKMTAPWKTETIDWSETPGVEWAVGQQQHNDLLIKGLAVVKVDDGFMLLRH